MKSVVSDGSAENAILSMTIRELTDRYPQTMSVLSERGLDLCCGGGHKLGEALQLHEIDQESTMTEIMELINSSAPNR